MLEEELGILELWHISLVISISWQKLELLNALFRMTVILLMDFVSLLENADVLLDFSDPIAHNVRSFLEFSHILAAQSINFDQYITKTLERGQWAYFTFTLNAVSNVQIAVNETGAGDIDLYLLKNSPPNENNFDYRDIASTPVFSLNITGLSAGTIRIY